MQYSVTPELTIIALWIVWLVSWTAAALWTNRTVKRTGIGSEVLFRVVLYGGAVLLLAFPSSRHQYAQVQLWRLGDALSWILVALTVAGIFRVFTHVAI